MSYIGYWAISGRILGYFGKDIRLFRGRSERRVLGDGDEPEGEGRELTKLVNPNRQRYGLGVGMEGPGKAPMNGVREEGESGGRERREREERDRGERERGWRNTWRWR